MAEQQKNKNSSSDNKNNFQWKKATRTLFFWIILFLGAAYIFQLFSSQKTREVEVTFSEYQQYLQSNAIEKANIQSGIFHGVLKYEESLVQGNNVEKFKRFRTNLPFIDRNMVEQWDAKGFKYEFKKKPAEIWNFIIPMLPWLLLIFLYFFFIKRMQSGGGTKGIFNFGKSRAKMLNANMTKVTFKDVAGADEAKQELQEIIEFLKNPQRFQTLGGRIPKGVLLLGPPGTGKTLLARAVAGEAGVPFFSLSGADFVEMFVGVGASRVRDLFEQGKKSAPCIVFIDEIDAVGRHRGAGLGGGHDEREQTLNQLLVEMDGFETNEGVILLAATNRPDVLDNALLRPGRFDRQVVVDRPDMRGREGILKVHTKKIPLAKDVKLDIIAKGTPGFSGADIANLVNEAALLAARKGQKKVFMPDFEEAKDKVMMGVERKSMLINDEEKRSTAYHESGHVLVSKFIKGSDSVHKVTIIPRGRALGLTSFLPIDEKHNYTKTYCKALLAHILGGRAAELLILNELSTGAGNDIEKATEIARKMVCEWGMSDKLGPVTFGKKSEEIFLGREISQHRDYSEKTAILIDEEIKTIVNEAADMSFKILKDHVDILHRLAEVLLERETLDGEEVDLIIDGKTLPDKIKTNSRKRKTPGRAKARKPAATKASGKKDKKA
ncbi:ATP-dependent zinc metalloprotease FtsH [bacterium]|nr:ATP-dependent zinc metalloprotease FtsH [bacterium]